MKKITIETMARIKLTLGTDGKIYLIVQPNSHTSKSWAAFQAARRKRKRK